MSEYAALVAIDWADQQHAVCLLDPSSGKREHSIVKHTPQALQEWALSLRQRFAGPIAVGLEQSRGPLIYALLQYDFFVLYPINPATLAKYRQAFSTAHGKDDPSDGCAPGDRMMKRLAPGVYWSSKDGDWSVTGPDSVIA